ncbi:hypothetical protein DM02DRAFT_629471 [Periconia macrospinosa]|uniref:Glycoside hydrolase family 18 protein n=1 Tax=Periconia macrospinosa TaxID=97972 RepID=A0A2V1DP02_9PLEO|nr:hypothetical protein DM02DRAFT_629471 [Periconia macrospinosa]
MRVAVTVLALAATLHSTFADVFNSIIDQCIANWNTGGGTLTTAGVILKVHTDTSNNEEILRRAPAKEKGTSKPVKENPAKPIKDSKTPGAVKDKPVKPVKDSTTKPVKENPATPAKSPSAKSKPKNPCGNGKKTGQNGVQNNKIDQSRVENKKTGQNGVQNNKIGQSGVENKKTGQNGVQNKKAEQGKMRARQVFESIISRILRRVTPSGTQGAPSGTQGGPSGTQGGPSGTQGGPSGAQGGPSGAQCESPPSSMEDWNLSDDDENQIMNSVPGWGRTAFGLWRNDIDATVDEAMQIVQKAYKQIESAFGKDLDLIVVGIWVPLNGLYLATMPAPGPGQAMLEATAPNTTPRLWAELVNRRIDDETTGSQHKFHSEDAAMWWAYTKANIDVTVNFPKGTYMLGWGRRAGSKIVEHQPPCGPESNILPSCSTTTRKLGITSL